jgi:hypothetical protein
MQISAFWKKKILPGAKKKRPKKKVVSKTEDDVL